MEKENPTGHVIPGRILPNLLNTKSCSKEQKFKADT